MIYLSCYLSVAQLDNASDSDSEDRGFDSHRAGYLRRTKKISPRKARFDRAFRRFFGKNFLTVSKDVKSPKTAKSGFELTQKTVKQNFGSRKKQSAPYFYQKTSIVLDFVFKAVEVFFILREVKNP